MFFNKETRRSRKMDIRKVMVVGSGFMGSGIAQVAATVGFTVIMQDIKDELVQKGMATIEKNLKNGVAKGKLSEENMKATLDRITPTLNLSLAKDCDAVIEVIFENKQAKMELSTPTHWITLGINTDLLEACRMAFRKAIRFLNVHYGMPDDEGYAFCSMAVDLRVTQVVDFALGIHAMIPKSASLENNMPRRILCFSDP
jgi:threonine dehydrogenase-like Zn-dependent dehydrogenase